MNKYVFSIMIPVAIGMVAVHLLTLVLPFWVAVIGGTAVMFLSGFLFDTFVDKGKKKSKE